MSDKSRSFALLEWIATGVGAGREDTRGLALKLSIDDAYYHRQLLDEHKASGLIQGEWRVEGSGGSASLRILSEIRHTDEGHRVWITGCKERGIPVI